MRASNAFRSRSNAPSCASPVSSRSSTAMTMTQNNEHGRGHIAADRRTTRRLAPFLIRASVIRRLWLPSTRGHPVCAVRARLRDVQCLRPNLPKSLPRSVVFSIQNASELGPVMHGVKASRSTKVSHIGRSRGRCTASNLLVVVGPNPSRPPLSTLHKPAASELNTMSQAQR